MEKNLSVGTIVACSMGNKRVHLVIAVSITLSQDGKGIRTSAHELSNTGNVIHTQPYGQNGVHYRDVGTWESVPLYGWIVLWKLLKQRAG